MKRQDRYERTTMYAPIWIANQIGEKGKENKLSPAMNSIKRTIGGGSGGNPQITTPPKKFQLLVWT